MIDLNTEMHLLILYFFVYGFLGWCCEVGFAAIKEHAFINRGFLNGPICPIYGVGVTIVIVLLTPYKSNLIILYLASTVLVTLLEGGTGWIMDKIFHNKWWDYSQMPFNIGGYVCLMFSILWGTVCVLIVKVIGPLIHDVLVLVPYTLAIAAIILFEAALLADLCVTVSAILKFNRHLERMEKIAFELKEISNEIGEDIYKQTMLAIERQENLHERTQNVAEDIKDASEEVRQRMEELRKRYKELAWAPGFVSRRLIRAFPSMQHRRFGTHLGHIRTRLEKEFEKRHQ